MSIDTLAAWHALLANPSPSALDALLADDVVFHSPVVHRPQIGKAITTQYLAAALQVLCDPSFRYVREFRGPTSAVLEFEVTLGGIHVNGVDIFEWNPDGRITDFKVMLRPLKAVQLVQEKMAALLAARQ